MKILMVGEFSGFYLNLKKGLRFLGYSVKIIAQSDGFKKIPGADIKIQSNLPSVFQKISLKLQYLIKILFLPRFDVIMIINPNIGLNGIEGLFSYILKKKSSNIYLSACGTDVEYVRYGLGGNMDYWPFQGCEKLINVPIKLHKTIANTAKNIIPIGYEYSRSWKTSKYKDIVLNTIPIPIETSSIKTFFPKESGKILFFHGIGKDSFKGTSYIKKALLMAKSNFPNDIEILIRGNMPLNKYLELMQKVDVVIDQCKSYTYGGMNSLYALSMGKIIMAPFRNECKKEYKIKESVNGIFHIQPDVKQIEQQILYIIKNKDSLRKWGKGNRKFVEKFHDSKIIAKRYSKLFKKYNSS